MTPGTPQDAQGGSYVVLVDQPEDWPETVWVEADNEDQARDRAAEFCCSENNDIGPFRPVGPAKRVTVTMPVDPEFPDEQDPPAGTELEVWKVSVY